MIANDFLPALDDPAWYIGETTCLLGFMIRGIHRDLTIKELGIFV